MARPIPIELGILSGPSASDQINPAVAIEINPESVFDSHSAIINDVFLPFRAVRCRRLKDVKTRPLDWTNSRFTVSDDHFIPRDTIQIGHQDRVTLLQRVIQHDALPQFPRLPGR